MEAYASLSIEGDLDKLAKQRGLGDVRHRRNIRQLITGVKEAIADSIFFLSYHPRFDTSAILEVLKYISSIELEGNASLSSSDTKILFAAINALSVELKVTYKIFNKHCVPPN
jgi:nuclear pore complex protein Nup205